MINRIDAHVFELVVCANAIKRSHYQSELAARFMFHSNPLKILLALKIDRSFRGDSVSEATNEVWSCISTCIKQCTFSEGNRHVFSDILCGIWNVLKSGIRLVILVIESAKTGPVTCARRVEIFDVLTVNFFRNHCIVLRDRYAPHPSTLLASAATYIKQASTIQRLASAPVDRRP